MTHAPLLHHLWQSTLCVLIAWALTLALRNNRAAVRYWIWLAASLKFLVPLSLLVSLGAQFGVRTHTPSTQPQLSVIVNQIGVPAGLTVLTAAPASPAPDRLPAVLFGIWLCGAAIALLVWFRSWWNIRALRRSATPLNLSLPIPVMSSAARLEPGVFGVFKPVLLLPEGIANRLTPDQLETVVAHELCHVRRRDNLTAVLHMLVETLLWFHPLVWWIGSRLADERERACDEAVLQSAGEPEVYAEGILQVCRLYLESPIACMSGISGADLRARIQRIMSGARAHNITLGRKLLLATVALAIAGLPLLIGVLTPSAGRAESQMSATPATSERSEAASRSQTLAPAGFDVATIKINRPPWYMSRMDKGHSQINFMAVTLEDCLRLVYGLVPSRIVGPEWTTQERYDIAAKAAPNTPDDQLVPMLRLLIEERFKLKSHWEKKLVQVYVLRVDKKGPRVHEAKPDSAFSVLPIRGTRNGWSITHAGMPKLVEFLSTFGAQRDPDLRRLIIDETGLKGEFDFTLTWSPLSSAVAADGEVGASVFSALQKQLGLKLEATKREVDLLVIDYADRTPIPN